MQVIASRAAVHHVWTSIEQILRPYVWSSVVVFEGRSMYEVLRSSVLLSRFGNFMLRIRLMDACICHVMFFSG